ncbi:MAG: amidohydrolase [Gammaproteobacteria bacterium TMED95]|nr:amidohydrolase [Gammaproteobacteria bacterium]OUV19112.1 MAG: amidohydrolase [Gammaproteobacteria bacterium TMED95]|tara:strand:+ start:738 stop:2435 length:1698 start_codon:yes stop_codon:yes gene_type:complete
MATFDAIISNGLVYDGTGSPPQQIDIGIKDGVIQAIGALGAEDCDQRIDASGKIVTPGFIDVHTHYDGQATWDQHLAPSSNLGTTTVVMGNCGVGFAPCRKTDHEVLIQLMEGVEEIPETAMNEGLPWDWESFPEYLDSLDRKPRDIDIAALYPHGPLRVFVMGERAVKREPATEDDIKAMQALLEQGMAAGAVGFSTSRTLVHRSSDGSLIPTYKAATAELKALGQKLSGEAGHVFQLISDWDDPQDEFSILEDTCAATGAKGTFTLLQLDNQPELWREQLALIEAAQTRGFDIRGQVLSRPVGMMMGMPSSMNPFYRRPSYVALESLPHSERLAAFRNPETKAKILQEDNENPHIFVRIFNNKYDKMYPLVDPIEYLPAPSDSVQARADREGKEPESWLYDYFLGNEGTNLVYIPAANYADGIPELLNHPHTVAALGDGGAHVGSICDASANLYLITKWVKQKGEIELSQGISMLTQQPAELYSLTDRGRLSVGLKADLNVIDLDALKLKTPHIVQDLPAGGKRFLQNAEGVEMTMVAGEIIYRDGAPTGALPGKLVRRQSTH